MRRVRIEKNERARSQGERMEPPPAPEE